MSVYSRVNQALKGFVLVSCAICQPSWADTDEGYDLSNPTPLIGITAVDDVMSDIQEPNASEGGAMGMQRFFTTKMVAALNNCVSQTQQVYRGWYKQFTLLPVSENIEKFKMTSRVWDKEKKGLFEASYMLDQEKRYIRTALDYYRITGEKVSPAAIESLISTYQLNALWNKLSEAMECDTK
ncbi:hypothetical protein [Pseudoteredinibacter isoporae]|uniref:hypothetical protein n=1 Tax=Pseudoteredinibacter isoporae TaxID=570281 RepID=UPI003108E638